MNFATLEELQTIDKNNRSFKSLLVLCDTENQANKLKKKFSINTESFIGSYEKFYLDEIYAFIDDVSISFDHNTDSITCIGNKILESSQACRLYLIARYIKVCTTKGVDFNTFDIPDYIQLLTSKCFEDN